MNRGSEWRVWDLHFHTPASYDYKDKSITNEDLILGLAKAGVSVVAITDHHVIDVSRIHELQEIGKKHGVYVLPGIEFCSELGGSESIHFIGIFSENADLNSIWTKIQGTCNLTNADIEAKGYERVCCEFVKTSNLILSLGGLITVHAGNKSNSLECIKNSLLVKQELKQDILSKFRPMLEIGKPEDAEGYKKYVFPDIKFSLPIIICSDNHDIKNYYVKEKMWIKADPTFEGLKQVLYEPLERTEIQQIKPDDKNIYQVIDSVTLAEDGFWRGHILLNPNLNTIIGGRSTGKSTLLKAIAAKHGCKETEQDAFIMSHLHGVSIQWKDGTDQLGREIDYFKQSYMHEIASDEVKTNELIESIIRNNDNSEIISTYYSDVNSKSKELTEQIFSIFQLTKDFFSKVAELASLGKREGVAQQIVILKKQISEIQKGSSISEDELRVFNDQVNLMKTYVHEIELAENDLKILDKALVVTPFNNYEELCNLASLSFRLNQVDLLREIQNIKLSTENNLISLVRKYKDETIKAKVDLEKKSAQIKASESYKHGIQFIEGNKEMKDIQGKLLEEEKKLSSIDKLVASTNILKDKLKSQLDAIVLLHSSFKSIASDVCNNLVVSYDGLVINVIPRFKSDEFRAFIESRLNQRGAERQQYIASILNNYDDNNKNYAQDILKRLLNGELLLKNGYDPLNVATELLAKSWYSLNYELTYQNDKFKEMSEGKQAFVILKLLLEFSDKKCPILIDQPEDSLDNRAIYNELVEYIKKKKKERQIILVTHNSNVVVSADAENVIVANQEGTDSHNSDGFRFQYVNGSLEFTRPKKKEENVVLLSQGIREHVCDILEGGKTAFEKRELKYGFRRQ